MDFNEKAKTRIEHWISHSDNHYEDYEKFAEELENSGNAESAEYIREMMKLTARSTECLKNALKKIK